MHHGQNISLVSMYEGNGTIHVDMFWRNQTLGVRGLSSANCVFLLLQELTTDGAFFIQRADTLHVTIIGILETNVLGPPVFTHL